jgi:hypothetical protein
MRPVFMTMASRFAVLALGVAMLGCTQLSNKPLVTGAGGGAGGAAAGAGGAGKSGAAGQGSAGAAGGSGGSAAGGGSAGTSAGGAGVGAAGASGHGGTTAGSGGATAGSGGATSTGGAGAGGSAGVAGTMMGGAGAGGTGGSPPPPCEGRCTAAQFCNPTNDRCLLKGGPCDRAADSSLIFCDDFENGDIDRPSWGSTFDAFANESVTSTAAHSGSGGLKILSQGQLASRLPGFAKWGFPIRVSFWMNASDASDPNMFFATNVYAGTSTFSLASENGLYTWVANSIVVPDSTKTIAVAEATWTCIDLLYTDAMTVKTTIHVTGKPTFALPAVTVNDFNYAMPPTFAGPPGFGPLSYGTLFVDDFLVTRDAGSVCP